MVVVGLHQVPVAIDAGRVGRRVAETPDVGVGPAPRDHGALATIQSNEKKTIRRPGGGARGVT